MARVPPPSSLSVRAFGPLTLVRGEAVAELVRRRERNVLATLLAAKGRPVSADRLVVEVWGEEAPPRALASLQVAVSQLRTMLEPDRQPHAPARVLLSTAAGYAMRLPDDAVDVWQFETLADQVEAATDLGERVRLSRDALALWSADPFAACETESVDREVTRLAEKRVTVCEIGARAQLDVGEPEAAVASLDLLLPSHPYRERLWSLYALGLYRTARQTDALECLRMLRSRLADDLGIDPSAEVTALERAILNQDPSLLDVAPVATVAPSGPDRTPPAGRQPAPAAGQTLVGREIGSGALAASVEQARASGRRGFAIVSGEPGIGKSFLVERLATGWQEVDVVIGRCHPDFAPALWPWLPVLRTLWSQAPDARDRSVMEPVLSETPQEVETAAGGLLRLFDAVERLLARAAAERPLVVVLEDIHWADVTSLRLLAHLATGEADEQGPVLVVLTLRTSDAPPSNALVATMADLARAGAARIRLEGLDAAGVGELLGVVLGPHDGCIDAVVAEVTGGNPFFVTEYARLLQGLPDLGTVDPTTLPVPEGVRDVLRQRLVRLPEDARRLLTTAAVAGRVDPELLSALTAIPLDDVLDLLDLALASGILADRGHGYAFAHALTRETLAGELSAARRLRLHDRISRTLEDRYGDVPDVLTEIAHHAGVAASLGPEAAARAATAQARAAHVAQARQAYDEALTLWQQAADRATGLGDDLRRYEALCGAAHSLLRLARAPEARDAVVEAVQIAHRSLGWDLVADAVAILNRAGVWVWREQGTRDDAFLAVLHEAITHVDDPRRARLMAVLQVEHYSAWERETAERLGEQSLEVARSTGDEALLLEVLLANVVASSGPGTAPVRLGRVEEIRRHDLRGEIAVFVEFIHARTLYECVRVDEADAAAARCAAAVADLRHTGVEVPLAWWFYARARDTEDATLLQQARGTLERLHRGRAISGAGLELLYQLRMADAATPVDPALVEALRAAGPGMRALGAEELVERGDLDGAVDLLGEPSPPGASDYSTLAERCLRVAVLAAAGQPEGIEAAMAGIEEYRGDVVTYGAVELLGAVDHFLALGAAALGDRPRAERHCAAALDLLTRLGSRRWLRRAEALATELRAPVDPVG